MTADTVTVAGAGDHNNKVHRSTCNAFAVTRPEVNTLKNDEHEHCKIWLVSVCRASYAAAHHVSYESSDRLAVAEEHHRSYEMQGALCASPPLLRLLMVRCGGEKLIATTTGAIEPASAVSCYSAPRRCLYSIS